MAVKGGTSEKKAQPRTRRAVLAPGKSREADLKQQLAEARAHQAATAEILKVISNSTGDLQPVLDSVANRAMRLIDSPNVTIMLRHGKELHVAANVTREKGGRPDIGLVIPLRKTFVSGLAALGRRTVHVADVLQLIKTRFRDARENQRRTGFRTVLAVPMLHKGEAIGVLYAWRREVRPFSPPQVALFETFADQAVIAIENARLFNETREGLEQQTAISEILRVISANPTDVQPVLDAVAEHAERLCDGESTGIFLRDGKILRRVAVHGAHFWRTGNYTLPLNRGSPSGRAVIDGRPVHVHDTEKEKREFPETWAAAVKYAAKAKVGRNHSMLAVPLIKEGTPIGSVTIRRREARPFSEKQIALVRTFADQAVIAIENVRLFNETKESLERQTASAEILKVIASSPTDTQPVFDAIAKSGVRLFGGHNLAILLRRGSLFVLAGYSGPGKSRLPENVRTVPLDPKTNFPSRAILNREIVHITDWEGDDVPEFEKGVAKSFGIKSGLMVPLLRKGEGIGAIGVFRVAAGRFDDRDIALLHAFADQAVIAIENVRLFTETREALERQTATAEILRVIASSPADVQPVLDTIVRSAKWLVGGRTAAVHYLSEGNLHLSAFTPTTRAGDKVIRAAWPRALRDAPTYAKAVRSREPSIVEDTEKAHARLRRVGRARGYRSVIVVPMLKKGTVIGTISVSRREPGSFDARQMGLLQTFADQAVIAIENVRLFNETKEALERQTATAEILRVISRSPTDVQPVFNAIAESAMRVFAAWGVTVTRFDGKLIHLGAARGALPDTEEYLRKLYPLKPGPETISSRCIESRSVQHVPDALEDPSPSVRNVTKSRGIRAILGVPMLRDGEPIGAINVTRRDPGAFAPSEIELLQTFADQAVIAIENVRLFNETKEALERQTATSEILKVIAGSPTDVQPAFDAIARHAFRLCEGMGAAVFRLQDGLMHFVAHHGFEPKAFEVLARQYPLPPRGLMGEALRERTVVHTPDMLSDSRTANKELARALQSRGFVAVPMVREGEPIGAIVVFRKQATPFSDAHIAVMTTFADQAVIAIENVRLFNETKEALERQTATAEILSVIASSPSDVRPVFEAIVQSALRLFPGWLAAVLVVDGDEIQMGAMSGADVTASEIEAIRALFPIPLDSHEAPSALALRERRILEVLDTEQEHNFKAATRFARAGHWRAGVFVPMLREGRGIGTVVLTHREPGNRLSGAQLALIQTFADQAVIAIENVRLFNETRESLERQTATAEILKVIASSPSDVQPVFDAIAASAMRLINGFSAAVVRVTGDNIELAAFTTTENSGDDVLRGVFPQSVAQGKGNVARAIRQRSPHWIVDTESDPDSSPELLAMSRARGYRSQLAVPMLRKGEVIGGINVTRRDPGTFSDHQIGLLATFADQAVIAIENVRLFNETKEALERQTATAEILKVISESPTNVQPVFDAILARAVALCGAKLGNMFRYNDGILEIMASNLPAPASDVLKQEYPSAPTRQKVSGRVVLENRVVEVPDFENDPNYKGTAPRVGGYRSLLGVPLLREGQAIGAIVIARHEPGSFAPRQIALVQTFADQAVIAIENVRLFNETKESLERQTATAEILRVISRSTTDTQPVFEAIVDACQRLFPDHEVGINLLDDAGSLYIGAVRSPRGIL